MPRALAQQPRRSRSSPRSSRSRSAARRVRAGALARARQALAAARHRRQHGLPPDRHREPALPPDARARAARHVDGARARPRLVRAAAGHLAPRRLHPRDPDEARGGGVRRRRGPASRLFRWVLLPLLAPGPGLGGAADVPLQLERVPLRLHVHRDRGEPHGAGGAGALSRRLRGARGATSPPRRCWRACRPS